MEYVYTVGFIVIIAAPRKYVCGGDFGGLIDTLMNLS